MSALASGCVYRINIQQGNFLDQAAVEQVKPGMTRSQVRYLLGTPMVADSFNKERWDYIYYLKKGRTRHVDSRRVTVYFDGEKVAQLDKPTAAEAAAQDASAAQDQERPDLLAVGATSVGRSRASGAARGFRIAAERPIELRSDRPSLSTCSARGGLAEDADRRIGEIDCRRNPDPPRPMAAHRRRGAGAQADRS